MPSSSAGVAGRSFDCLDRGGVQQIQLEILNCQWLGAYPSGFSLFQTVSAGSSCDHLDRGGGQQIKVFIQKRKCLFPLSIYTQL